MNILDNTTSHKHKSIEYRLRQQLFLVKYLAEEQGSRSDIQHLFCDRRLAEYL